MVLPTTVFHRMEHRTTTIKCLPQHQMFQTFTDTLKLQVLHIVGVVPVLHQMPIKIWLGGLRKVLLPTPLELSISMAGGLSESFVNTHLCSGLLEVTQRLLLPLSVHNCKNCKMHSIEKTRLYSIQTRFTLSSPWNASLI
jgi:hypothetical protein